MNAFVASIILSQDPLDDFLQKTPEERLQEYGDLVGSARMVIICFQVLTRVKMELMQSLR